MRKLFGVLVVLLLAIVFLYRWFFLIYPFGNHDKLSGVESVSWLPKEASNIYSRNSGQLESYEFSISEEGFLDWAKSKGLAVKPITEEQSIYRYSYFEPVEAPKSNASIKELQNYFNLIEAKANVGYVEKHHSSNGSGYEVLYNAENKRAYYWWVLR